MVRDAGSYVNIASYIAWDSPLCMQKASFTHEASHDEVSRTWGEASEPTRQDRPRMDVTLILILIMLSEQLGLIAQRTC
jgi:hypothetical protein